MKEVVILMKKMLLEKPALDVLEEFSVGSRKLKIKLLRIDIRGVK
jgi:hypothetical protein